MNSSTSNGIRKRLFDILLLISSLILLAFYVHLAISANSDLSDGRFALFMDERITFDGVKRILHPNGLVYFLDAVLNGGDQRYGRDLWNSIAIFSAIPEKLFGDSGQIFATRMLQVILIIASYFVFAFGILRSWLLRFTLLFAMLAMPFSSYFMTMPKPEPLQLLFLTVFSYFFYKNNAKFSWHWIFIGLAFGTKISTLPALLVFISISLAATIERNSVGVHKTSLRNASMALALGLAIAVPILLPPILLSIVGYFTVNLAARKFGLGSASRTLIAAAWIIFITLASHKVIKIWVSSTFLNTTHGADQASINAISWINYFFHEWLIAPPGIGIIFFTSIIVYLTFQGSQAFRSNRIFSNQKTLALSIAVAGLMLNIAIIIGAKRLWGFYLYPGMVLMIAGAIILADLSIFEAQKNKYKSLSRTNAFFGHLISLILLIITALYWAPQSIDELKKFSLRTHEPEYILQYSSYKQYTKFLDRQMTAKGRQLRVMFTPSLFPPESNGKFNIIEFWGPYIEWSKEPDIIIFGIINTPRGMAPPRDSPSYNDFLIERQGYAAHVTNKGGSCKSMPCFERELELPNGGEVLVLSKAG